MKKFTVFSIRTRLLAVYIGIIIVGFSGLTVIAGGQITVAVRADYEQRLQNEVRLIAQGLSSSTDVYVNNQINQNAVDVILKSFESQIGGTLKLYILDGPRPSDMPGQTDGPEKNGTSPRGSFFNQPELETALRGETVLVERKNDEGENMLCTAAPLFINGQQKAMIQLTVPKENMQGIVLQRWAVLGIGFALLTSLALLASLLLSRSIIRPLEKLRESANQLSRGDFSHRVTFTLKDEIGEVAEAFNEMAGQVQSMLEEQRAFASNTSHELRTPLTAIRLRTEALRNDTTLDESTARQYIEEIDDEIASLADLIQELTLLSRFDAGRAELGHDQIDLTRLATTLYKQVCAQAIEKNIQFSLTAPEEPVLVNASLSHLTVVFRNLLENALKYTPANGKITWSISEVDGGVNHTIQDTGQGISPQHLPHVFERFFRADRARSRDIPGTGLGLALVKSIVDAYHGHISIESEGIGKGATVKVYWPSPVAPQDNADLAPKTASAA